MIYAGTNCFHRRKVIYGLYPDYDIQNGNKGGGGIWNGNLLIYISMMALFKLIYSF
jgi:hypothetical protein